MSDLRDALEKLADKFEDAPPGSVREFDGLLRDLLRFHPAEPVGVSDEAVEKAASEYWKARVRMNTGGSGSNRDWMRAALEAVAPLMGAKPKPRPVEELVGVLTDPNWGKGATPIALSQIRDAVRQAIADELDSEGIVSYGLTPKMTDAVFSALGGAK